jgi:hypothetical protein
VWRVLTGYEGEERVRRIVVCLSYDDAAWARNGGAVRGSWARLERSTDGVTWEPDGG